jgi:hypothetical protein
MLQNPPGLAAGRVASGARCALAVVPFIVLVACAKDQPAPKAVAGRSAPAAVVSEPDSVSAPAVVRWDAGNGSAIYLPGEGGVAQVLLPPVMDDSVPRPDSAMIPVGAAPASVELFSPSGRVGTVALGEYASANQPVVGEACDAWATVPLRDAAGIAPQSWRIALQAGVADPITADSLGSLSRADSAMLVVEINKAAALLPLDSAGLLRRVPFGVSKAYRLRFDGEVEAVIAVVERRLNLEAAPRVERTVLVLERPPKVKTFSAVWRETQYATEDDLVSVDLMTVVRFKASNLTSVFLGMDFGDGSRVEMLERSAGGIWTLRWASAYTGC